MTPPVDVIDRHYEKESFQRLTALDDDARVLALGDRGGNGKSSLLKFLHSRCRSSQTPVSLVDLNGLGDRTPLAFAKQIARDLRRNGLTFEEFDKLDRDLRELQSGEPSPPQPLDIRLQGASGTVNVGGGIAGQGRATGTHVDLDVHLPPQEKPKVAEDPDDLIDKAITAFLKELAKNSNERLVVVMVDAYEHAGDTLGPWLLDTFLNECAFDLDRRPSQLITVVAGRELPDCAGFIGDEEKCERIVIARPSLSPLESDHVRQLYQREGVENPSDVDVQYLVGQLRAGKSIEWALKLIRLQKEEE